MADIFLSYAREDERRARLLAAALESRGWSVFWDRRIPHGRSFRKHIQQELDAARCIVVLWSNASLASQFVLDEASEGLNDGRLVPTLIEAVRQPLGFRGLQAANLTDWHGTEAPHDEFERLVGSIGAVLQPSVQPAGASSLVGRTVTTSVEPPPPLTPPVGTIEVSSATADGDVNMPASRPVLAPGQRPGSRIRHLFFDPVRGVISVIVLLVLVVIVVWWWPTGHAPRSTSGEAPAASNEVPGAPAKLNPPEEPRLTSSEGPAASSKVPGAPAWNPPDKILEFVEIPAGTFTMGSDKTKDPQAYKDEVPQRQMTLPAFLIGRYEVTVGQYKACARDGGCTPGDAKALEGSDDLPVRYVSWHEALAYCGWLEARLKSWKGTSSQLSAALAGRRDGRPWHVTLPSEAEWERAARGTDGRIYPWGDRIDAMKANYFVAKRGGPTSVGSFPSGRSPEGLFDMSGNVWEWTRSHDRPYPYRSDDGREDLKAGDATSRVERGGSFGTDVRYVRAAYRSRDFPSYRGDSLGFRVVVSPFAP